MTAKKASPATTAPIEMPAHLQRETQGPYDATLDWVNETYVHVPTPQRDLDTRKARALVALRYEQAKTPENQRLELITALGPLS